MTLLSSLNLSTRRSKCCVRHGDMTQQESEEPWRQTMRSPSVLHMLSPPQCRRGHCVDTSCMHVCICVCVYLLDIQFFIILPNDLASYLRQELPVIFGRPDANSQYFVVNLQFSQFFFLFSLATFLLLALHTMSTLVLRFSLIKQSQQSNWTPSSIVNCQTCISWKPTKKQQ